MLKFPAIKAVSLLVSILTMASCSIVGENLRGPSLDDPTTDPTALSSISADYTYGDSASGGVNLSWPPPNPLDIKGTPAYSLYYSDQDNIGDLDDLLANGTLIPDSPIDVLHYESFDPTSNPVRVTIKPLEANKTIYFNVLAKETGEDAAQIAFTSTKIAYKPNEIAVILNDGENFSYITRTAGPQMDYYTSYSDIKGAAPATVYTGAYNHSGEEGTHYLDTASLNSQSILSGPAAAQGGSAVKPSVFPYDQSVGLLEEVSRSTRDFANKFLSSPASLPSRNVLGNAYLDALTAETVGTQYSFNAGNLEHPSTLQFVSPDIAVQTGGGTTNKVLKIWVEDESWHAGGTKANLVTPAMVQALADKFLKDGLNNDIYDWVSNIYGEEWGDHSIPDLIPASNEINILLADINDDEATDSGVLGMFWGKDNALTDQSFSPPLRSNKRIMFYADSVFFSHVPAGNPPWSIDDVHPSEIVTTLTHEFVHMLYFYQGTVKRERQPDTWLNELVAMGTEDLIAEKLGIAGPRGYKDTDGLGKSSSVPDVPSGRLPLFNKHTDTPLFTWLPSNTNDGDGTPLVLQSYAVNYVYAAYLVRNFGGPEILQKIMYGAEDQETLEQILTSSNLVDNTFVGGKMEVHIPKLFLGILMSDRTGLDPFLQFNNDGWFQWTLNGVQYRAGSINFYDYEVSPRTFNPLEISANFGQKIPANTMILTEYPGVSGVNQLGYHMDKGTTILSFTAAKR